MKKLVLIILMVALAGGSGVLQAQIVSQDAQTTAEILEDGIREFGGDVSTAFFNVAGTGNSPFSRFAVASFSGADFRTAVGNDVASVNSVSFAFHQANAGFTADGQVNFYFSNDATINIADLSSPHVFDSIDNEGINGQFTRTFVGSGGFTETNTGDIDTYTFNSLSTAASTLVTNAVNNGEALYLIAAPGDATVNSTWSGAIPITGGNLPPELTLDVVAVPEPTGAGFLGFGLAAWLVARRRRAPAEA